MKPSISELNYDGGCVIEAIVSANEVDQPIAFNHTIRRTPQGILIVNKIFEDGAPKGSPYQYKSDIDNCTESVIIVRFDAVGTYRFIPI